MKTWNDFPLQQVHITDVTYPKLLKEVSDPPETLYYRGTLDAPLLANCIAVVGSRRMSRYGRQVSEQFVSALVAQQITVISGFMYGIDIVAHSACVAEKGRTIAVFGSGINQVYPTDCEKLYTSILREKGLVMSEFSPEQKPKPWMYAKRNRIVASMANMGTIVIEAGENSGSLLTAKCAVKLQRPLYAVPGQINSDTSKGTNWLIKTKKAKLITSVNDIIGLKKVQNSLKKENTSLSLSPLEKSILKILKTEGTPLAIDEIVIIGGLNTTEVSTQISLMHMRNLVDEVHGKYILKN